MNSTSRFVRMLLAKRRARFKEAAVLPGIIALLFLGLVIHDAGAIGAVPYVAIVLMSASYLIRPMWICWAPLFAAFTVYTALIAMHPGSGPTSEWVLFLLMGFVPALLLWFARPREIVTDVGVDRTKDHEA